MSGRESLIEIQPPDYQVQTGQVQTGALPTNTLTDALAGGTFGNDFAVNDLVVWLNDAGKAEAGVVSGVAADVLTLFQNVQTVSSGGAGNVIYRVDSIPPYFYPADTVPNVYIRAGFDQRGGGSIPQRILQTEEGLQNIDADEGVNVKSLYVRFPYQFTTADGWVSIELSRRITGAAGAPTVVDEIGENGIFHVNIENMEIPVNQLVAAPAGIVAGQTWNLFANLGNAFALAPTLGIDAFPLPLTAALASTVDMPAILEYTFQPVIIGARIRHADTELT